MLTIDPARRRSILRATARQVLKAPRRFVSMTASQSSSLMRAMSVSRVTPALLTSDVDLPELGLDALDERLRPRSGIGDVRLDRDSADLARDRLGRLLARRGS